jgi:exopolysaccharide biosynthesis protein
MKRESVTLPYQSRRWPRLPVALATAAAIAALPAAAHAADPLTLIDQTEQLGPGLQLRHVKALGAAGWTDYQVLTADLGNAAISSDLLAGDVVASRAPMSQLADRAGAVAGVNGDFFDIDNSNAPTGSAVKGGEYLKSSNYDARTRPTAGVTRDGIGQLVDMTIDARAVLNGGARTIRQINTAGAAPTDGLVLFTPQWGTYSRARAFVNARDIAEVLVRDGRAVEVSANSIGAGEIPADAYILAGRDKSAQAIRRLVPGDPVTINYGLTDTIARQLQFGVGGNEVLIRDGAALPRLDATADPRTAIGFKDGGRTMLLMTNEGRQTSMPGMSSQQVADVLLDLGAEQAMNLDSGGSTELVAREVGDSSVTVRNSPSDGSERPVANGVGLFVSPGNGQVDRLLLSPTGDEARIFPGLHRTLRATAADDHLTPVALQRGDVRWSANEGTVDGGLLHAPENVFGQIRVRATTDAAQADVAVRVLGQLHALELDRTRLAIPAVGAGNTVVVHVTGRDEEGFTAPVGATDLDLDYDDTVIDVRPEGDALKIVPKAVGGTLLHIRVGGEEAALPISVGGQTSTEYAFDDAGANRRWVTNGTTGASLADTPEGLQLTYRAARNVGFNARLNWDDSVPLPGQPLAVRIRVKSAVPISLTYAVFRDPSNTAVTVYGPALRGGDRWETVEFTPPPSTRFPVRFSYFQAIETNVALQRDGVLTFGGIEVDNPSPVELPEQEPLRADALVSRDGSLQDGEDFTFATLSDVQFTHVNTEMAPVAIQALRRIRATRPDLVVLNGDIVDLGERSDIDLARRTLEAGGCELIELGTPTVPEPTADTIPCLYVPGNHESYLPAGQGTLDAWRAEFGRDYGYTDHKGTRFITLNSSLGSLRGSDFAQLPYLQQALADAAQDESIDNVMVFAHHPVLDPRDTHDSELGDRIEVDLVEQLLSGFREESGKGVAMVGSHAQIMNVHREQGVPYVVLPSSGKAPYGTPDRGGITGWVRWGVDSDANAAEDWLKLDVHPFAQSIDLQVPESIEVGASAPLGGTLVQPTGVANGSRTVPLRYPLSLRWSGSENLAVGSGDEAIDAARAADKVAILDPATGELTALQTGSVDVTVEADSMRDGEDMSPISATRTVQVTASTAPGPKAWISAPVFPDQFATTIGEGQPVTVANTGDEPLELTLDKLVAVDGPAGDFVVADDACSNVTIAPGGSCTVLVRFVPSRVNTTSSAKLVFSANTAERRHTVTISATSTGLPRGDQGEDGIPGIPGEDGPAGQPGAPGRDGTNGTDGRDGADGTDGRDGANGADGSDGAQGPQGSVGPQGEVGQTGPAGSNGADGPQGPQGVQGAKGDKGDTGARGAKGDKGAPGRDAIVTCTVRSSRVTCKVTYSSRSAAKRATVKASSKATLVRNGRTFAKGTVGHLHATRRVTRGHYTLQVGKGRAAAKIAVTVRR